MFVHVVTQIERTSYWWNYGNKDFVKWHNVFQCRTYIYFYLYYINCAWSFFQWQLYYHIVFIITSRILLLHVANSLIKFFSILCTCCNCVIIFVLLLNGLLTFRNINLIQPYFKQKAWNLLYIIQYKIWQSYNNYS